MRIETKYNIGDEVFAIYENDHNFWTIMFGPLPICNIRTFCDDCGSGQSVRYRFRDKANTKVEEYLLFASMSEALVECEKKNQKEAQND